MPRHIPSRHHRVELLEPRQLLALVAYEVSVNLFRDLDRDGLRDPSESALPGWTVRADDRVDSGGLSAPFVGTTDSEGALRFTTHFDDVLVRNPSILVSVLPSARWWCTNHGTGSGGYEAVVQLGNAPLDTDGAPRGTVAFALTDRQIITGTVRNHFSFTDGDGETFARALAGRRVWNDLDGDARIDADEPVSFTDVDGSYRLKVRAGVHTLRVDQPDGWAAAIGDRNVRSFALSADSGNPDATRGPDFSSRMIDPTSIDVAIAYTSAAAAGRDDRQMLALVRDLVASANAPFANSDTNVKLNLVRVQRTDYVESGRIGRDLDRLQLPDDGFADDVARVRDRFSADIAVLLTSGRHTRGDSIGLSYEYARGRDDLAFDVVALQQNGTGDVDWTTLAHELGHNLGAGHDTEHSDASDLPFAYAHGWRFRGEDGRAYKDVMSYGDGTTLPFFSTPEFSYAGKTLGDARAANNATVIEDIAPLVALYR
jgi:hypothetical protein